MLNPIACRIPRSVLPLALALFAVVGCGAEELSDESFGVMDLAPYYDGGTPSDPSRGLPLQLDPLVGYAGHDKVEFYDFGTMSPVLNQLDPVYGVSPAGARVAPMYFFFDKDGNPLFANPVREGRTGSDFMPGGRNALNPNPHDYCNGKPAKDCAGDEKLHQDEAKKKPYSVRLRDPLMDTRRNSSDFQRPIIDLFQGNPGQYTGLWEIVEVTVPKGYKPDAIKQWTTLKKGIDAGDFIARKTQKVINCPVVDERTGVTRGVSDRPTPRPRIDLWYRRKLAYCYLADGWETLGDESGMLYKANSDASRLDTFDVNRVKVGQGDLEQTALLVPATRLYIPTVVVPNQDPNLTATRIRMIKNMISDSRPRHKASDPPGYSPIRWMWDFLVPSDYILGTFTGEADVDDSVKRLRDGRIITKNIATRGSITPCSFKADPKSGFCEEIEHLPDPGERKITVMAGDNVVASTKTWTFANGGFSNADIGKKLKVAGTMDPNNTDSVDITDVRSATQAVTGSAILVDEMFDATKVTASVYDPSKEKNKAKKDPVCGALELECNKETCSCDSPAVGYGKVCGPGIARCKEDKDEFSEWGYSCFPAPVVGTKGFCYVGCDGTQPNKDQAKNGEGKPHYDSRCKGLEDYFCLGFSRTPSQHRFCVKVLDFCEEKPESTQCDVNAKPLTDDGTLSDEVANIGKDQVCVDWGIILCQWPDEYEPK